MRIRASALFTLALAAMVELAGCGKNMGNSNADMGMGGQGGVVVPDGSSLLPPDALPPESTMGCGNTTLLVSPGDPSERGAWDVGVKTATVGRLTVEVLYPAQPGSTAGMPEVTYDVRDWLPPAQKSKVPDANSPAVGPIGGHLYRDVPVDGGHGPYPVIIAIHGTASFRIASGSLYALWASRGFVVLAADYPGIVLRDELCATVECLGADGTDCATQPTKDIPGDVTTQLTAIANPSGDLSFLAGHLDASRVGITGHSQGACVAAGLSADSGVQVVMPMAGSLNVLSSSTLKSVMYIAGIADKVIGYTTAGIGNVVCTPVTGQNAASTDTDAYNNSPGPPAVTKRLIGITGGGHLLPTDLCQTNAQGKNAIQEAQADGVCGIGSAVIVGLPALFDCGSVSLADGFRDVGYASTAAFEETLHCKDESKAFTDLQSVVPQVGDYQHAP